MAESESEGFSTKWFSETHLGLPGFVWAILALVAIIVLGLCMCMIMSRWRYKRLRNMTSIHLALKTPAELEFWVQADRKKGEEWGMLTEPCAHGLKITAIEPDGILERWNMSHKALGWKVNDKYDVNVRHADNAMSKIIGKRRAGSIVFGTCHQEFVELASGNGYIAKESGKGVLLERVSNVNIRTGDVIVEIDGLFGAEDIQKEMFRRKVERFFVRRIIGVSDADLLPGPPATTTDMKMPEAVIEAAIMEQIFAISDTDATALPLEFGSTSRWRKALVPAHQMDTVREACRTAFDEPGTGVAPTTEVPVARVPKRPGVVGFGACCTPPRARTGDQILLVPEAS